ncbi:DMT family transporter [Pseudonocardia sp. CA-107938]|uniref:DMT family transporter n=1 Tax=Pseudonocardia sp. CA-107938 TaxID=3240021 RepID=UPI003D92B38D
MTIAPPATRSGWLTFAAVGFTVLAWASAFVGIRAVGATYGPGALSLGRLLVGVVALGGLMLVSRRRWVAPTAREWGFLALCGLSWFAVYNLALNDAETRVDAGTTAMLVNVGPVLIALFAGLLLGEGFPRWLIVGALVAFSGAVLVGAATADGTADLLGVLLCLAAAVTYAIGVLSQKPLLRRLPGLQVTFTACAIGAVACLPFAPSLVDTVATAPAAATLGVVYLGLVPTALAFSTWAYALARMDAGRLGVSTYVVPPVAVVMSAIVLGEFPPLLAIVGGAVCLVGVAITRRR